MRKQNKLFKYTLINTVVITKASKIREETAHGCSKIIYYTAKLVLSSATCTVYTTLRQQMYYTSKGLKLRLL